MEGREERGERGTEGVTEGGREESREEIRYKREGGRRYLYVEKARVKPQRVKIEYSGTSDKGPSEIGTASLQGTKLLAPKCPLFGGSTVYPIE